MLTALVMAGGRGERMSRSGGGAAKPLVRVGGVPLIERNVQQLLRAGAEAVVVALSAEDRDVHRFVAERLVPTYGALGTSIEVVDEHVPLGNIGAAGLLADRVDSLLVVYADNLTCVDLGAFCQDHADGDADLTLAAHEQSFRVPFGELGLDPADHRRVTSYTEKPAHHVLVCSGVAALGRAALKALAPGRPTGISELTQTLLSAGAVVRSWPHQDPWIDVNDVASAFRAEQLVAQHPAGFDTWWPGPVEHRTLVVEGAPAGHVVATFDVVEGTVSPAVRVDRARVVRVRACGGDGPDGDLGSLRDMIAARLRYGSAAGGEFPEPWLEQS